MAPYTEIIFLNGVLQGNGYEAHCAVRALKVTNGPYVTFTKFTVTKVSPQLPPGNYDLVVNGEIFKAQYEDDCWTAVLPG